MFFALTEHLPKDDPYRFKTEEDVPADLATTTVLTFDVGTQRDRVPTAFILAMTPLVGIASAQDFYFPREIATKRAHPRLDTRVHRPSMSARFQKGFTLDEAPKRAEPKPGRNEPCYCGSGKKYKKCHGA